MKKLYSILAVAAISATAFGQGSESFTNTTATANGYTDGSYTGDNGVVWTFGQARKTTTSDVINGTSLGFNTTGTRFVRANSGANGVGTLTYTVSSFFTGGVAADRTIEVWVNGVMQESFTLPAMTTDYTRTVSPNVSGDAVIEFKSVGTRQIVIDDVSWTAAAVLGVTGATGNKSIFIKNTVVSDELVFGTKSSVKIFNTNGQLVKSGNVTGNSSLNVSDLGKGVYIVTGEMNGKTVSEKIIKK